MSKIILKYVNEDYGIESELTYHLDRDFVLAQLACNKSEFDGIEAMKALLQTIGFAEKTINEHLNID